MIHNGAQILSDEEDLEMLLEFLRPGVDVSAADLTFEVDRIRDPCVGEVRYPLPGGDIHRDP